MDLSPVSQAGMIVKESMQYILDPEELTHYRDVERGCFLDKPPALILLQEQYWILNKRPERGPRQEQHQTHRITPICVIWLRSSRLFL